MVYAHQGGWDEALIVVVPLLVVAALLLLANRRAKRVSRSDDASVDDGQTL